MKFSLLLVAAFASFTFKAQAGEVCTQGEVDQELRALSSNPQWQTAFHQFVALMNSEIVESCDNPSALKSRTGSEILISKFEKDQMKDTDSLILRAQYAPIALARNGFTARLIGGGTGTADSISFPDSSAGAISGAADTATSLSGASVTAFSTSGAGDTAAAVSGGAGSTVSMEALVILKKGTLRFETRTCSPTLVLQDILKLGHKVGQSQCP